MVKFVRSSAEVFYVHGDVLTVGSEELAFLKAAAMATPRLRSRACLHDGPDALVHEMIIVHHHDAYVRPHRHLSKEESLLVIEGQATGCIFDDAGNAIRAFPLAPPEAGGTFFYHMPVNIWHTIVITSEWFVFLETTRGPFDQQHGSEFARFSPDPSNSIATLTYMAGLRSAFS